MIHIGAIRKIFRGWRILICAWVDDNSPLKSQFFMLFRGDNGKEYIKIGKGYDPKTDTYPRQSHRLARNDVAIWECEGHGEEPRPNRNTPRRASSRRCIGIIQF